jgi:hypothetical protein
VRIPGVAEKLSQETYWTYLKSRDGTIGVTDAMKREVANACFDFYQAIHSEHQRV